MAWGSTMTQRLHITYQICPKLEATYLQKIILPQLLHFSLSNLSQVRKTTIWVYLATSFALFPIKFVPDWRPPKYLHEAILPQILHVSLSNLSQVKKKPIEGYHVKGLHFFPLNMPNFVITYKNFILSQVFHLSISKLTHLIWCQVASKLLISTYQNSPNQVWGHKNMHQSTFS